MAAFPQLALFLIPMSGKHVDPIKPLRVGRRGTAGFADYQKSILGNCLSADFRRRNDRKSHPGMKAQNANDHKQKSSLVIDTLPRQVSNCLIDSLSLFVFSL
jgi:hypothetical protein